MASDPTGEAPKNEAPGNGPPAPPPALQARRLLRSARSGCLATVASGQPFASLVTPACMPDGSLLLLLSRLSEHTRHLAADARCSLMVSGAAETANPQTTPRISVTGLAEVVADPALKARYLSVHPYATLYADFGDFATWRIKPVAGLLVAGFGRAHRLKAADLAPDPVAMAAIQVAEAGILTHCNRDHPDALSVIAGQAGDWRMVTVDVDGFDLRHEKQVLRIDWSEPVKDAADVRRELVRMTNKARAG